MNGQTRISWPVRMISALLALLAALALVVCCAAMLANSLLASTSLYESVALDARVTDAQMARITARAEELAAQYDFAPQSVLSVVTQDSVTAYGREVIDWGMGLLGDEPVLEPPAYPAADIEAAVRADELFQASIPAVQQRTVARDSVAYEMGRAVSRAVLPLRTELIALVMPRLQERISLPVWMNRLAKLPLVSAGTALGLMLMIWLFLRTRPDKAALYAGTALAGAALTVLGLTALLPLLNLGGMAAELSDMLALQCGVLYEGLALRALLAALPLLVCGYALIFLHQRSRKARP